MKVVLGVTYITLNAEGVRVSYAPGSVVDMDDRRAAKMIASNEASPYIDPVTAPVVVEAAKPQKPAKPPKPEIDPARVAEIAKAIGRLDPKDPDHFSKNGRPFDAAVESAFGEKVSAAEIDAAMAAIKAAK
jgi:hypothetical protein